MGRALTNGLVLGSAKASRRHASIHAQNGGEFWLIDLGSVNGTFLNGRRVFQPMRLHNHDLIEVAGEQLTFRQDHNAAESEAIDATLETAPRVKLQRCWLLIADIEQFTQLSQSLEAEDLAMTVGQWVRDSREAIEKFGGVIDKYLGDGYLAFWRDGIDMKSNVAAAITAIDALRATSALKFRLVLHFGDVIFGGSPSRGEECLMGPEVNYIFRMEKIAGALHAPIACSSAARAKIESVMPCERLEGEHELKGFEGKHRFHAIKVPDQTA